MKRFLFKLFLFSLPLIGCLFLFDFILTKQLKKFKRGDAGVWSDIFSGRLDSDILIYGSSRAWVHIDPKILEDSLKMSVYNLGLDGYNFDMQYCRHQVVNQYNRQPKIVILSLDYTSLEKRKDLFKTDQFLPYLDNLNIKNTIKNYEGIDCFDNLIPFVKYFGRPNTILTGFSLLFSSKFNYNERYKGYKGRERKWGVLKHGERRLEEKYTVKIDTPTINKLISFIEEMQAKKIKLVFVYSPEYKEGQLMETNRKEVINIYYKLAETYKIPFFDYSNSAISYNKSLFYNSMHLNKNGAELFTRQFATVLKRLKTSNE